MADVIDTVVDSGETDDNGDTIYTVTRLSRQVIDVQEMTRPHLDNIEAAATRDIAAARATVTYVDALSRPSDDDIEERDNAQEIILGAQASLAFVQEAIRKLPMQVIP